MAAYTLSSLAVPSEPFFMYQDPLIDDPTCSYCDLCFAGSTCNPPLRQLPPLPYELVHYIFILAALHHPSTHSSLRLTSSWVRKLCQKYMAVSVIIRTHAKAIEFANFMVWQCKWELREPFKVDAIWLQREAFRNDAEACIVPYILERCPRVENVAVSEKVYTTMARSTLFKTPVETSRISRLTLLGDDTPSHMFEQQKYNEVYPSTLFQNVSRLVLYNNPRLRHLYLGGFPNLTHVALRCSARPPDLEETRLITDDIRASPRLQCFVVIYCKYSKNAFANWIKECRQTEKKLYALESTAPTDRIQNDISWWREDAIHGTSIWERAQEHTSMIESN
jgi:hypothetical protein